MTGRCILILVSVSTCCFGEWVLVPSITTKQDDIAPKVDDEYSLRPFNGTNYDNSCPDFHNLTWMGYTGVSGLTSGTAGREGNGWEVTLDDIKDLLKENGKIPKTPPGKTNFVSNIGETLMMEAEKRIKNMFHPSPREARFSSIHFPSMEGSLMTISMLLFGVYLSKLILKLLQSHYNKYQMPIRTMGGIRAPILIAQSRKERSIDLDVQTLNFMNLMDAYNSQFN